MLNDIRVALFVRVPADLKEKMANAAWMERVSVSRYVEDAIKEKLRRYEEMAEAG